MTAMILPLYWCDACQTVYGKVKCQHAPAAEVSHVGYGAIEGGQSTSQRHEREQESARREGWRKFGAYGTARRA